MTFVSAKDIDKNNRKRFWTTMLQVTVQDRKECKSVYRCSTRPHSKVGVKPADIQRSEMQAAAVHMKSDTSSEEQKKRA